MNKTMLYLQASSEISKKVSDKLESVNNEIEFLTASMASDALGILDSRDVTLIIADCYIEDMKLFDFVSACVKKSPQALIIVCIDSEDISLISRLANIRNVTRVYLYPWDINELVEGSLAALDEALLKRDYANRRKSLNEDMKQFDATIDSLKEVMNRQHYSYSKLKAILEPFIAESIELKEETLSDPKDLERQKAIDAMVRKSCKKFLRIMTTSKLDYCNFCNSLRSEILDDIGENSSIKIGEVYSCFMENATKDRLGIILYILWLIVMYVNETYREATIDIISRYDTESKCRFTVNVEGTKLENNDYTEEYVKRIISCFSEGFEVRNIGSETVYTVDTTI